MLILGELELTHKQNEESKNHQYFYIAEVIIVSM